MRNERSASLHPGTTHHERDRESRDATRHWFARRRLHRTGRQHSLGIASHRPGVSREQGYEAVLMQGSGTFGLESVISSVIPRKGRFVVLANWRLWRAHGYDRGAIGNFHQAGTLAGERIAAPRGRATSHRGKNRPPLMSQPCIAKLQPAF